MKWKDLGNEPKHANAPGIWLRIKMQTFLVLIVELLCYIRFQTWSMFLAFGFIGNIQYSIFRVISSEIGSISPSCFYLLPFCCWTVVACTFFLTVITVTSDRINLGFVLRSYLSLQHLCGIIPIDSPIFSQLPCCGCRLTESVELLTSYCWYVCSLSEAVIAELSSCHSVYNWWWSKIFCMIYVVLSCWFEKSLSLCV